jgi:hypothetical protein
MARALSRPTAFRLGVVCGALGLASATAVSASAQQQISVVPTEGARTLAFDLSDDRGRVAVLTMIVRAQIPSGTQRELRIRFHPTGPDAAPGVVRLNEGRLEPYPARQAVVVTADGRNPSVRRGQNVVRVRFGLAHTAEPAAADGLLCVRARGARFPAIQVQVVGKPPTIAFRPETAKLRITRDFLGLWGRGGERQLRVSGPGVRAAVAGPAAEARLGTEDGQDATARLSFERKRAVDGHGEASVRVSGWDGAGTYEGTLQVNPGADQPTAVLVEAKVRHHWLWAVLVVLCGGAVGGVGLRAYALHRRREILRIALKDAEKRYRLADKPEDLYAIEDYTDILGTGERFPGRRSCRRDETRAELAQLYCDVHKLRSDAEFEAATQRTRAIVEEFERWLAFKRERDGLRLLLETAALPGHSALREDVEDVLRSIGARPPDAATAEASLEALRRWRRIVAAYTRLGRRFAALDPMAQRRLTRYDPESVYAEVRTSSDAPPAAVWRALIIFEAAHDALARPADAPVHPPGLEPPDEPPTPESERMKQILGSVRAGAHFAISRRLEREFDLAPPVAREVLADRRTATQIARSLRRWDYITAGITAIVTAVAYVVTIYDDTWGDILDYLSAFGAGFLAQGLVAGVKTAFEQLPPLRSYRLDPAEHRS